MTDEEKAEEYVKEQILKHNKDVVCRPKNAVTYIDELKQAYLDGLAEGRNSYLGCETSMNKNYMFMYSLKLKENAELNRDNTELFNSITELNNKVAELESQNEKMKNKLNCSKYHYCLCKDKTCKDCKDWKMND